MENEKKKKEQKNKSSSSYQIKSLPTTSEGVEHYKSLFLYNPNAVYSLDLGGFFTSANENACRYLGYGILEVLERDFKDFIVPEDLEHTKQHFIKAAKGQPQNYETRIIRRNREVMSLNVTNIPIIINRKVTGVYGIAQDITKQKQSEDELRKTHKLLDNIIEFLPDATLVIDKKGRVIAWNKAMERMTNVKAEEMLGKGDYEYAVPFYDEKRPILIDLALCADQEREKQYTSICRTGDTLFGEAYTPNLAPGNVHLSATASVLRDAGGDIIAAIECIRDNTERKGLEAQLQQAQKMEAIGALAGGIAHDFNNLLMVIHGNISLIMMNTDISDPCYERLKTIEDQIVAGTNLTKQLLGFARVGKYEMKSIDLNKIVEKSSNMFGRTKKEILIRKKYTQTLWPVEADASQLEQVLLNLYVNAHQAMPGGGNLYIETANHTVPEIRMKNIYMEQGRYVKVSVTDTGVGMDEKIKNRIFEPFFTTKEMGRGTGLGLAMVYGIIKGHKGYVNVYSERGKGTTFNIYLPASGKDATRAEETTEEIIKGEGNILLVDDEINVVAVMREMLKILGYQVLTAGNGKEALKIYNQNKGKIDLVILDMIMPGMSGEEIFESLKEIDLDVKVVLSSGYSVNGDVAKVMALGCRGFIQKPVSIAEISRKISEALRGD